jgi:ATP-dependent Lhr-like helicase
MAIGTITSDQAVAVKYANGRTLGTIEESFVGRLRDGERFVFAGKPLELVRLRQMTATVRPRGPGRGRAALGRGQDAAEHAARRRGARADRRRRAGRFDGPEMEAVRPLLELQASLSRLPADDELLIETIALRDGFHAFVFPFGGRLAHEGLGAVLSLRLSRHAPASITAVGNDYGIELSTDEPIDLDEAGWRADPQPRSPRRGPARVGQREPARAPAVPRGRAHRGADERGLPGRAGLARARRRRRATCSSMSSRVRPGQPAARPGAREVMEGQLEVRRLRAVLDACAGRRAGPLRARDGHAARRSGSTRRACARRPSAARRGRTGSGRLSVEYDRAADGG